MDYVIVERNIGRAGNKKVMEEKQKKWDELYGVGNWVTGYEINNEFYTRENAIEQIYDKSYFDFLDTNPKITEEITNYIGVFNPHSLISNSTDIQSETIERYMNSRNLQFKGSINKKLAIGTYQPKYINSEIMKKIIELDLVIKNGKIVYPYISKLLSPYSIKCIHDPSLSVEEFWQSDCKCLAIKN